MDNPCKHCPMANPDFVNDNEYGCDTPCQNAKDFWKTVNEHLDDLIKIAKILLREGGDEE